MLYAGFGDGGAGGDPDENAQNLGRMLGKLIRIDPAPRGRLRVPASNPFARPQRRPPGDLCLRAAQPVPLLVRPQARPPDRSATSARTRSRRSTSCPAAAAGGQPRGGYNFGWDVFEGRDRYEDGSAPGHVPPGDHPQPERWLVLDHRRLRDPRPVAARDALRRPLRLRRPLQPELRLAFLKRPRAPPQVDGPARVEPRVVRGGRAGQGLRCVDRRAGLSHRTRDEPGRTTAALARDGLALDGRGVRRGRHAHGVRVEELLPGRRRADPDRRRLHARARP